MKKKKLALFLAAVMTLSLLAGCGQSAGQTTPAPGVMQEVDVILFAGQSNMAGRGVSSEEHPERAPALVEGAGYEFRAISNPTKLTKLREPFGAAENNKNGIYEPSMKTGSMVTAFVNAYYQAGGVPVVAVSASQGGSIIGEWQPDGTYLPDALERLSLACRFLEDSGEYSIRHVFVAWCQGESDGDEGTSFEDYKAGFDAVMNAFGEAGAEKVFMVRIGRCNAADDQGRYDEMLSWQNDLAEEREDVVMVSLSLAGMRERGLMKDDFHYFQQAYNEVGTEAGTNAANYVNTGVAPDLIDPAAHTD